MRGFLFSDLLWALMLVFAAFAAYTVMPPIVNKAELAFYDFRAGFMKPEYQTSPVIIEVNNDSSEPGSLSFDEVKKIAAILSSGESAPALTVFTAPTGMPDDSSSKEIAIIKNKYEELRSRKKIKDSGSDFLKLLTSLQKSEKTEQQLAAALKKNGKYIMPVRFTAGMPKGRLNSEPEWLKKYAVKVSQGAALSRAKAEGISFTTQKGIIPDSAAGAGHSNVFPDIDGKLRFENPFMAYDGRLYPSLALEASRILLDIPVKSVEFRPGREIVLGEKKIPLTPESMLPVLFSSIEPQRYASREIIDGSVAPEIFRGKTVFMTPAAQRIAETPRGKRQQVYFLISALNTLTGNTYISRPQWTYQLETGLILLAGIFTAFVSSMPSWTFHSLFTLLFAAVTGGSIYAFCSMNIWIKPAVPLICLAAGYLFGVLKRFSLRYELKQHRIQYSNRPPPPPVAGKIQSEADKRRKPAAALAPTVPVNVQELPETIKNALEKNAASAECEK